MFSLRIFAILLVAQCAFAGYDQWIDLYIENVGNEPIQITGSLEWGKWYKNGDKSQVTSDPDTFIQPGEKLRVSACGRADSASGTEGTIHVKDRQGSTELVTVKFDCPWSGSNDFRAIVHETSHISVSHSKFTARGALGEMNLRVVRS